jgi:deoxyribonuclease-4
MSLGAHLDLELDLELNIKLLSSLNANICQLLITNIKYNNLVKLKQTLKKHKLQVIMHSNYTNNIAQSFDPYSPIILTLKRELKIAHFLKAKYLVVHIGKSLMLPKNIAYNNMYTNLLYILSNNKYKIHILLETPAGQGTEMCVTLEDFAYFYNKFNHEQKNLLSVCIDTCHIFASGYDITNREKIASYLHKFNKLINLKHVKLIHLNDSLNVLNSHLDRHDSLGNGYIGFKNLFYIFSIFYKLKRDIILETPNNSFITEITRLFKEYKLLNLNN